MVTREKKFNTRYFLFLLSHLAIGFARFLQGIYTLPLMTAEGKPSQELTALINYNAIYEVIFVKRS